MSDQKEQKSDKQEGSAAVADKASPASRRKRAKEKDVHGHFASYGEDAVHGTQRTFYAPEVSLVFFRNRCVEFKLLPRKDSRTARQVFVAQRNGKNISRPVCN